MLSTGGFNKLLLISSNAFYCSSPQMKGLPFFVNSYMGFNSFCSSGKNMLTKLTTPAKLLQTFWFVEGFNFWIVSSLLLRGFTQTLFSLMMMVLPMYCNSVLNNWHFFGKIFKPFLHNTHRKSISFSKYVCLLGMNSNRSSMIASQYFLLDKQLKMVFMYDCHTGGEILSPIGILWYKYNVLPKYGSIPQYFLELSVNVSEWNASFRSSTDNTWNLLIAEHVFQQGIG